MTGDGGPPRFAPSYFDIATGGELPAQAVFETVTLPFVWTAQDNPLWQITSADDATVRIHEAEAGSDMVSIGFEALGHHGLIRLAPDPSGWIVVSVLIDGGDRFRAYLENVYEEYEFHPSGATRRRPNEDRDSDSPGRIGKRRNWITIDVRLWPHLAVLANRFGYVTIEVPGE